MTPPTIDTLRPPHGRWTPSRKADVVWAVTRGQVARAAVLQAFDLTEDELKSWEQRWVDHGYAGLKEGNLVQLRRAARAT